MMKRLLIMIAIIGLLASLSCAAYAAPASIETVEGTTGYQYGIDNFIGLNAPSNLEANYSTMQETTLNGVAPVDNVLFLRYDNQLIFDKYAGFFVVNPSADDTIYSMAFGFDDPINCAEIIDQISAILGRPIHRENYNDKRFPSAHFLWFVDDVHYYDLDYAPNTGRGYLTLEKLAQEAIDMRERYTSAFAADDSLRTTYDNINEHRRYLGLSIEDAIKERGAVYDRSEVDDVVFSEIGELFGYGGRYEYVVDNPNRDMLDYRTDFIGEIIEIRFRFDNMTEAEAIEIADKFASMYGDYKDEGYYSWDSFFMKCTLYIDDSNAFGGPTFVFRDSSPDFFTYDPSIANTDNIEEFAANRNCDWELLNVDSVEYSRQVWPSEDSFNICLELAQESVLKQLKSPSTAVFGGKEDTTIRREGNTYRVSSWVDAQNSFGATIRTNFFATVYRDERTLPDNPLGFTAGGALLFE